MKRPYLAFLACVLVTLSAWVQAGGGAQNVALVVNADSWASLTIANEYIYLRGIPTSHVIYLEHVPNFETININVFREQILKPVLKTIEDRGLKPQIDYLVYSADLPYAIDTSPDTKDIKLPKVITRTASITGLTFLHERVLAKDVGYLRLDANRYVRSVKISGDTPFTEAEQKRYVEGLTLLEGKAKNYDAALPILEETAKAHPKNFEVHYNLSCCLARLKKLDEAMVALKASIDSGWFNAIQTREDDDLTDLRTRQDFKDILTKLEKTFVATQPEHGFRSAYAWNEKGEIANDGKGEHYLLSTMLAETSGRGTSVNEALSYLRRAAQSDGTHPDGTIYYMINGDIRSKTRRWAFPSAVAQLGQLGVKAEIIEGKLPQKKSGILGLMAGTPDFNFAACDSTILPGAICEHLTSNGGELTQHRGQTECTTFLRFGAAGTSGTVEEPFALQQKFPTPFIQVHYARGCSLAESFFQSLSGPYRLIVVGDPLCAPWRRALTVSLDGVKSGDTVKGTLTLRPSNSPPSDIALLELYVDGTRHSSVNPGEAFVLDTSKFPDGPHDIELVGIANDRIETQGRLTCPVMIDNQSRSVAVSAGATNSTWDQTVVISAQMKGAAFIEIQANGHTVGRIAGELGGIVIPARRLGLGRISVQALGYIKEGEAISVSGKLALNIEPKWLEALQKDPAATNNALRLQLDDGVPKSVIPARNDKWLAAAGLTKGHHAALDAWFDTAADDLYQFQLHTPMAVTLEIDGIAQPFTASKDWCYIPLALKKGAHRLQIKVDATNAEPSFDARFGGSGTHSLEANQFQCVDTGKALNQ